MILYFADRNMNIIGQASTELPNGLTVYDDLKTEDIETGVASFECRIPYDKKTRKDVEKFAAVGNYILRNNGDENEFYTIIESEGNTRDKEVYVYAEDAGLDLLNEIVGDFEATEAHPIEWYVEQFAADSGFEIGLNEISTLSRKLSWEGETTVTDRLASVATQFDGCEISYSFKVEGLLITNKYINIHKQRGKDAGVQLRLNKEVDRIITKQNIANLATALKCKGGTPDDDNVDDDIEPVPITLEGFKYDDGDFYVDGDLLKSRQAVQKWSRYVWNKEPNKLANGEGHIVRLYDYDTLSQSELCNRAITELKKAREIEVNYEVDIKNLPKGTKIGDRVNIVDDEVGLYVSARILLLETSIVDNKQTATIGEYLIKDSGISEKVAELASKFAEISVSASRANKIADEAKNVAESANTQAQGALQSAEEANTKADEAKTAADTATQSATAAQTKADEAKAAVEVVEGNVAEMEQSVVDAEAAAELARQAAETAETKAEEAHTAAVNAGTQAQTAEQKATEAQTKAEEATESANAAQNTAETAKTQAEDAATEAAAAKFDAQQAQKDIDALGDNLTTLEQTMAAEYARKTDLTEAEAKLQTQITQNAAGIKTNASKVQVIDETANDAAVKAQAAYYSAEEAQAEADAARQKADEATQAATDAWTAYESAQAEADTAKTAAETAQSVLDEADAELTEAEANLAEVESRADATEEEILEAQQRVEDALRDVDNAQADADSAKAEAEAAQATASKALQTAEEAQTAADSASAQATIAQKVVEQVAGSAAAQAQKTADEAKTEAQTAQATADEAKANATTAQSKADEAAAQAATAQQAADDAEAKAQQAQTDLDAAKQNLANVTSRVDATEEEVAAAKQAVETAQQAADNAKADAETAQATADTAKANAQTAQQAADNAKTAADNAQQAADEAKAAADKAQEDVDALAVRVTKAETSITQNAEAIGLRATKEEVTQTLGGYYTKEESDANLTVKADEITSTVETQIDAIQVGGRNLHIRKTTVGGYMQQGEFHAYGNGMTGDLTTDWIDISQYDQITITLYDSFTNDINSGRYDFFDEEKNLLREIEYNPREPHVVVENVADAYYMRATMIDCLTYRYKIEGGNKSTDYTPAPEDVDASIADTSNDLHDEIIEQTTQAIQTCDSMLMTALESYVTTGDYCAFKESVQSQLEILTENITLSFTKTQEAINSVDADLQDKFNTITTYFTFDIDGLIIGKVDNPYKMVLSNERYSMTVNGEEVLYIDVITKMAYFPKLTVTDVFNLLGYQIETDADGLVNWDYVGGE